MKRKLSPVLTLSLFVAQLTIGTLTISTLTISTLSYADADSTNSSGIGEEASDFFSDDWGEDDAWADEGKPSINVGGFLETLAGRFNHQSNHPDQRSALEYRGQFSADGYLGAHFVSLKVDILNDEDQEQGSTDVREAYVSRASGKYDFKIGRQPLTWGTGDLLFLNDLFPKDWQSFFSGREISYLKAPSDAVRITRYDDKTVNVDLALLPKFQSDNYLTGERFSFFNPSANAIVVAPPALRAEEPDENPEYALRLFKTINGTEYAGYFYDGFYKQPLAFDAINNHYYFPELQAIGFSLRKPALGGIFNSEISYYDSKEDSDGDNPLVVNSQLRLLAGYERELVAKLTGAMQYYVENIRDHDALVANSFNPDAEQSENRHTLTLRLRYMMMQDKLTLSWFSFYSPNEEDSWLLPSIAYRYNDHLQFETGANIFSGDEQSSFLGQFDRNDNFYLRARLSL